MVKNNKDTIDKIKKSQTLTDKEKSTLLGLLQMRKRYGLVWEDKPEDVEKELEEKLPVFTEVKELALINDTKDLHNPNHILIEGDNLHALTALSYTHAGKIDVIYIDPPYNTGNKDFVYNDKFVDSEDTYRHSKWLSFMSKRLKIAKQLLSEKGVIFISIDDNEQAQLKLLCDEIFGQQNFVGEIIWETATDNNPTQISIDHEYVFCYAKNKELLNKWSITSDKAMLIKAQYEKIKKSGITDVVEIRKKLRAWIKSVKKSNEIDISGVAHYNYVDEKGVFYPGNSANTKPGGYNFDIIHPITHEICAKPINGYRWPAKTFWDADAKGDVLWGDDETTIPKIKKRIETATELLKSYYYEDGRAASKHLESILGIKKFNNPKPLRLILKLINFSSRKNSIILDFFAGSGTTLHATMQLNEEDGGHRQCILVTNNENHICEEVTYERNKRVIEGYTTPKGEPVEGLHHNNLRYYKTDFVPRDRTMKNMRALVSKATDMLCVKEDLYQEVPEFGKLKLPKSIARHFTNGIKEMLIIYREECIDELVDVIMDMDFEKRLKVYVFSPDRDPFEDEFEEVEDKVEICALPAAIYDAYVQVLPKCKDKSVEIAPESEKDYENEEWDINDGEGEV